MGILVFLPCFLALEETLEAASPDMKGDFWFVSFGAGFGAHGWPARCRKKLNEPQGHMSPDSNLNSSKSTRLLAWVRQFGCSLKSRLTDGGNSCACRRRRLTCQSSVSERLLPKPGIPVSRIPFLAFQ